MVRVVAMYRALPGKGQQVVDALAGHVAASRREPGCLEFVALRSQEDPDALVLVEAYRDDSALEAHRESRHFREILEAGVVPLLAERRAGRYEEVAPVP